MLPSSLKLCESTDSLDTLYLNQSHSPIINPLKKLLNIKLYNENGSDHHQKYFPPFKHDFDWLFPPSTVPTPFPTLSRGKKYSPSKTTYRKVEIDTCSLPILAALCHSLLNYDDLFFIKYTPEDTLRSR